MFCVKLIVRRLENFIDLRSADKRIDLGQLLHQVVAITFDQTTGDDDACGIALGFPASCFEDRVNRFLFCGFDEATRIHDDRVGLVRVIRYLVAGLGELAHHYLAIHEVLWASKADKSYFLHKSRKPLIVTSRSQNVTGPPDSDGPETLSD